MTIEYRPNAGLTINGKDFNWGDDRLLVRKLLSINYSADDQVIDLSGYNDGDSSQNIDVKRDIYGNSENPFHFYLNYDLNEKLESIEIHKAAFITIEKQNLTFEDDITAAANKLSLVDASVNEIDAGEFLFPIIKVTIASNDAMGGDGTGFAYFYGGSSIEHLLE